MSVYAVITKLAWRPARVPKCSFAVGLEEMQADMLCVGAMLSGVRGSLLGPLRGPHWS